MTEQKKNWKSVYFSKNILQSMVVCGVVGFIQGSSASITNGIVTSIVCIIFGWGMGFCILDEIGKKDGDMDD